MCKSFQYKCTLQKKKYTRGNQRPFMNKHISKEITKGSKLRNKFLKTRNNIGKFNYNKQGNFWVSLIREERCDWQQKILENY